MSEAKLFPVFTQDTTRTTCPLISDSRLDGTVQTWSVSPAREFRSAFSPVILYLLHLIADSIAEAKELRKTFRKTHFHIVQFSTR